MRCLGKVRTFFFMIYCTSIQVSRHLTKNHHPTQITLILLPGRVCLWIVVKAWVCKVDAFLFKTHDFTRALLFVKEPQQLQSMYCSHYVTKDSQSFANGCSPENDAPSPPKKNLFIFKLFTFSSKYSVPGVWRISKKNMSLSFHFLLPWERMYPSHEKNDLVSKSKVWKWYWFP